MAFQIPNKGRPNEACRLNHGYRELENNLRLIGKSDYTLINLNRQWGAVIIRQSYHVEFLTDLLNREVNVFVPVLKILTRFLS
jgi:hypothetical protein